jgi:RHS repeat-associated protein
VSPSSTAWLASPRFGYDAVGNLVAISDAENESRGALANLAGTTQYAYDSRNLLAAEAFPTGQVGRTLRAYGYDGGRRLTSRQVGLIAGAFGPTPAFAGTAEATAYAYDAANRLVTRSYAADVTNDTFAYDAASRLTLAVSARYATTVGRAYDAAGRLTSESLTLPDGNILGTVVSPATSTVGYQYDADNRTTGLTYPTGTQVARTYTDRNELASVSLGGLPVASRSYDVSGRLTSSAAGNGVIESRSYVPGSYLVASIAAAPPVGAAATGFSYTYDAAGRKLAEDDTLAQGQSFAYDLAGRLIDWKRGPATQTWNLSLVGDWNATARDGVTETRQNSWVHEAVQVGSNLLTYDLKGNLTTDEKQTHLTWDPENRLTSALVTPDASETGFGAYATYRYDALGRRVAKTVNAKTTLYLNAGAQTVVELERPAIPTQAQVNGAASDGTAANAALPPASGGILTGAVTRINFQPEFSLIPSGFYADKGKAFPATGQTRTNGLTYGWTTDATAQAVERHGAVPLAEFDTFIQAQTATDNHAWSIALPNGTYPVIVVAGDALSTDQTNHLVIGGQAVTDATPATATPSYESGNFDGYAVQATVTNGVLTISPGTDALRAKLCFVEIGAIGTTISQATRDKLAALVARANAWTGANPEPVTAVREYAYGSYIDDTLAFTTSVNGGAATRYYVSSNSLYSPAALTDAAGQVVERYKYDAYGTRTVTTAGGTVLPKSTIGFNRGFTGYISDPETSLSYARSRMYSPGLGRFISRDPMGYVSGSSLYGAYFAPNGLDPLGLYDQAGHFATTYLVALAAGYTPAQAYKMALWSQIPDQVAALDAMAAGGGGLVGGWAEQKAWANKTRDDVQAYLHDLSGGRADERRAFVKCLLKSGTFTDEERGLLLHAMADTYAHSFRGTHPDPTPRNRMDPLSPLERMHAGDGIPNDFDTLFPNGSGHAVAGHAPDHIASDPAKYSAYVADLFQTLSAMNPGATANPALLNQLTTWASSGLDKTGSNEEIMKREYNKISQMSGYSDPYNPSLDDRGLPGDVGRGAAAAIGMGLIEKMKNAQKDGCCGNK